MLNIKDRTGNAIFTTTDVDWSTLDLSEMVNKWLLMYRINQRLILLIIAQMWIKLIADYLL